MRANNKCQHGKPFVPVVPDLALTDCCAYGRLTLRAGAVDDARALVARQPNGLQGIADRLEQKRLKKQAGRDSEVKAKR